MLATQVVIMHLARPRRSRHEMYLGRHARSFHLASMGERMDQESSQEQRNNCPMAGPMQAKEGCSGLRWASSTATASLVVEIQWASLDLSPEARGSPEAKEEAREGARHKVRLFGSPMDSLEAREEVKGASIGPHRHFSDPRSSNPSPFFEQHAILPL